MARIVEHNEKSPVEAKAGAWVCMCGLSKNKPLCDGSHKQTLTEEDGKLYKYENGKRTEINLR